MMQKALVESEIDYFRGTVWALWRMFTKHSATHS